MDEKIWFICDSCGAMYRAEDNRCTSCGSVMRAAKAPVLPLHVFDGGTLLSCGTSMAQVHVVGSDLIVLQQ